MTVVMAMRRSPCHREVCCGGPARVWCPKCGASYQADDPRLIVEGGSQPAERSEILSTSS
ncbi:MAG: hypothetical protein GEV07_13295 [Streptosporangiales bacterium]|nr:hypothetical protein [Streptosporangiales bacterium]